MQDGKGGLYNARCIVTLRESKQAMTRPFSTWQLREGWANLHSASDREQVPLWNSRHTSRVSHLVSRPMVMLTAIRFTHKYWAVVERGGWKNDLTRARVTKSDARKSPKQYHRGNRSINVSSPPPPPVQIQTESFGLYFGGWLLVLPGKSGSWSFTGVR